MQDTRVPNVDSKESGLLDCLWTTDLPTLYMNFILKVGIIIVAVSQRILKSQFQIAKCLAQGWATRRNSTIAGCCNQSKGRERDIDKFLGNY